MIRFGLKVALALALLLLSGTLHSQASEVQYHLPLDGPNETAPVFLGIQRTRASALNGGLGFIRIQVRNRDKIPHSVSFDLDLASYGPTGFRAHRTIQLAASEKGRIYLPMPASRNGMHLRMRLDGGQRFQVRVEGNHSPGLACLSFSRDAAAAQGLARTLDAAFTRTTPTKGLQMLATGQVLAQTEIPPRWQLLSGFDLIRVALAGGEIRPESQAVLTAYLSMGGRVVLVGNPGSPDSILGRLIAEGEGTSKFRKGRSGFGQWAWVADQKELYRLPKSFKTWLADSGFWLARAKRHSGSAPDDFYRKLHIPGLGEVPVRLFFFLILVFAVLVGPVNLIYWRRKKKPQMLLLSVPVAGIAFTALILTYGFIAEGFDIKGSIRSMTLLDQRDHRAVNLTQRTLFAGLGPDKLDLGPGTHLETDDRTRQWRAPQTHILDMDLDHGNRLSGTILPSRTETNLVTWTHSKTRERLAFQRTEGGNYRVIETGGLVRNTGQGDIVFRDLDGKYWVSNQSGADLVQDDSKAKDARMSLLLGLSKQPYRQIKRSFGYRHSYYYSASRNEEAQLSDAMRQQRKPGVQLKRFVNGRFWNGMPPGSYLVRVGSDPAVDGMGIEIRYGSRYQLVLGLLAKEDIR